VSAVDRRSILVEGTGRLATAVVDRLRERGAAVERVDLLEPAHPDAAARIMTAAALVLTADDDARNVDLVLWARRLRSDLPLVARVFDTTLAHYLSGTVERLAILSMSAIAAPVFAETVLASLAAPGERRGGRPPRARARRGRWMPFDRVPVTALLGLVLLVGASTAFFARALDLRPIDSLYFVWTTVMTVGYGDISLRGASDLAKVIGMLLMLAGAAFMATLFALLTGWVVTRRLEVLQGRVKSRARNHVVVAGAGNVGFRVAELLARRGWRLVIVERNGEARNLAALRAAGHQVIVADATEPRALELAGLEHASAVLAVTDSDAVNLQIALGVRGYGRDVPVVMRVGSPELSEHVTQRRDGIALSSVAVASRAFADAALTAVS
jgi:voltage-gated potassium channel Kch/multidrug transporter EmrE-like cation transporter